MRQLQRRHVDLPKVTKLLHLPRRLPPPPRRPPPRRPLPQIPTKPPRRPLPQVPQVPTRPVFQVVNKPLPHLPTKPLPQVPSQASSAATPSPSTKRQKFMKDFESASLCQS